MADHTITLDAAGNANPDPQPCHVNETIIWNNQSGQDQDVEVPACLRPADGTVTIPPGQSSKAYTVVSKGHYGYRHHQKGHGPHNGPNGTINVS